MFEANSGSDRIRTVQQSSAVQSIAGMAGSPGVSDGPAATAQFREPGIAPETYTSPTQKTTRSDASQPPCPPWPALRASPVSWTVSQQRRSSIIRPLSPSISSETSTSQTPATIPFAGWRPQASSRPSPAVRRPASKRSRYGGHAQLARRDRDRRQRAALRR